MLRLSRFETGGWTSYHYSCSSYVGSVGSGNLDCMDGGASMEATLELWASSLGDVKARMRPLFTQERVA